MSWKRKLEKSWGRLGMKYKLSDICSFRKGKVEVENLNTKNYISTENMLPNKCGIIEASSLPSVALTQEYKNGDILVSNIRPYFKKIWKAKYDGGCSNDVLVFVAKSNTDRNFLYYVLSDDYFFTYSMTTSKGTKMPRGDKTSIMQYEVPMIDLQIQKKIASILKSFDEKIELNNVINNNLPPHPCYARIAAKQRRQTPKTDECLYTDGKVSDRGGNEETAEQFSSLLAA